MGEAREALGDFLGGERDGEDRRRNATRSLCLGILAGFAGATVPLAAILAHASRKHVAWIIGTLDSTLENLQARIDRQELENLGLLSESMRHYAIFRLDPEGKVTTWNSECERILGYRAGDMVGRRTSCFYGEDAVKTDLIHRDLEWASLAGGVEEDRGLIRKDGFRFGARVTVAAIRDRDGGLTGFTHVVRENEG